MADARRRTAPSAGLWRLPDSHAGPPPRCRWHLPIHAVAVDRRQPEALPAAERFARQHPCGFERCDATPGGIARVAEASRHTQSFAYDRAQAVRADQHVTGRSCPLAKRTITLSVLRDFLTLTIEMDRDVPRCGYESLGNSAR